MTATGADAGEGAAYDDGEGPGDGPDLRLAGPAAAAWLTALVVLGAGAAAAYVTAVTASVCAVLVRRLRTVPWRGPLARPPRGPARGLRAALVGVLVCVAASALGTGLRLTAVESGPVRALATRRATATLDAVITGDPRVLVAAGAARHRETVLVNARVEEVDRRRVRVPVLVLATDPVWRRLSPSHRIRFAARLDLPHHGELLAAVALVRGPPSVVGGPSAVQRVAGLIRARLRAAVADLPPDERGVLPGLVDGDTSGLDPALADAFERSGLTHLMAVSGENLSLIVGAVLAIGRFAGLGRRSGPVVAGASMFGFVIVARPSPSVLRATVMGVLTLVALVSGRERRGVPALCAAVLILVLIAPDLARSYGFALSTLATAGILLLAPRWRSALYRLLSRPLPTRPAGRSAEGTAGRPSEEPAGSGEAQRAAPAGRPGGGRGGVLGRGLAGWSAEALAVAAAAHVACAPVLALLGTGVSLVAIPANVLAAPAVGAATLLGALTAIAAPMSLTLARLIAVPAGFTVGWITGVARFCAGAPYATVGWPGGLAGAALLSACLVAAVVTLRWPGPRRIGAVLLAAVVLVVLAVRVASPGWPPRGWLFVACDVGQGDGLVLFAGPGRVAVVDAGPDPRLIDGCLHDLGVGVVTLLVLTHPHADHIDGVPGVLQRRAVGPIVISPDSAGEERRLLPGREVRTAGVGDVWTTGPLTLTVLGPLGNGLVSTRDPGSEVNNASVVLLARWPGLRVLLCGDVEMAAQRELLAAGLPPADVMKVPHHGSSHQDPAFLAAAHAAIAITSVGAHNDYGHPAPVTMATLARLGERTYRTDRDGDIAVVRTDGGLAVVTRR